MPVPLDAALEAGLEWVASAAAAAREPWWVIGSAAMALHGALVAKVADIDLLMSPADARALLGAHGTFAPSDDGGRFRSDVFGHLHAAGMPVDVMAGFRVRVGEEWRQVLPTVRHAVALKAGQVFIPSVADLIAMCRLFDRPKDHERLVVLLGLC